MASTVGMSSFERPKVLIPNGNHHLAKHLPQLAEVGLAPRLHLVRRFLRIDHMQAPRHKAVVHKDTLVRNERPKRDLCIRRVSSYFEDASFDDAKRPLGGVTLGIPLYGRRVPHPQLSRKLGGRPRHELAGVVVGDP